ncbi:hypothetical protein M514_08163 [Trichuris suis]|uniref:Uncharacterized protein n=1 Tax=Trichuris suis TaxID=68888 RepID=A0A085NR14_9BILA|nr:hypothetical protein M514_08163 [Trichuris suis]
MLHSSHLATATPLRIHVEEEVGIRRRLTRKHSPGHSHLTPGAVIKQHERTLLGLVCTALVAHSTPFGEQLERNGAGLSWLTPPFLPKRNATACPIIRYAIRTIGSAACGQWLLPAGTRRRDEGEHISVCWKPLNSADDVELPCVSAARAFWSNWITCIGPCNPVESPSFDWNDDTGRTFDTTDCEMAFVGVIWSV